MKTVKSIKQELDWCDYLKAKTIKELYPNVSSVTVRLMKYNGPRPIVEVKHLMPSDKAHLSVNCLNPDCTSLFTLTNQLLYALRTGVIQEGTIACDGYETDKPGAYSCSCRLKYTIKPIMKKGRKL